MFNIFKSKYPHPINKALKEFVKLNPKDYGQLDIVFQKNSIAEVFHSSFVDTWGKDIETLPNSLVVFFVFSDEKPGSETYLNNLKTSLIFNKTKSSLDLFPEVPTYYYTFQNKVEIDLIERDLNILLSEIYKFNSDDSIELFIRK